MKLLKYTNDNKNIKINIKIGADMTNIRKIMNVDVNVKPVIIMSRYLCA